MLDELSGEGVFFLMLDIRFFSVVLVLLKLLYFGVVGVCL